MFKISPFKFLFQQYKCKQKLLGALNNFEERKGVLRPECLKSAALAIHQNTTLVHCVDAECSWTR